MNKKIPLKKIMRSLIILFIALAIPTVSYFANNYFSKKRGVASSEELGAMDGATYDLSEVSPMEFKKAFKYQLLKNLKMIDTPEGQQMLLGSFLLKDENGNSVPVCDLYPTLDLIFAADGVATSGDIPQMLVRMPCLTTFDKQHIESFPIPLEKILQSPISHEFKITYFSSKEDGRIYIKGAIETWPQDWAWVGLKLYGKNPNEVLEINGYEVISVLGEPLLLGQPLSNE